MQNSDKRTQAVRSILLLLLMAILDYITGYELVFSAAYLLPVGICGWYFSRRAVLAMAFAGGVATWIVDWISGNPYSHFLFSYWNSFVCFLISAITGLVLHRLRVTVLEREAANERLRRALEDLERSTREIRKLQEGLQVICAWTKRIKVDDQWMTPDEFLCKRLHLKLTHGISPEGERVFYGDIAARELVQV